MPQEAYDIGAHMSCGLGGLRANRSRRRTISLTATLIVLSIVLAPIEASASAIFTYDQLGRLTTALYDNGTCVTYGYDPNGNRTSVNTIANAPSAPTWGSGTWGCFNWTAQ